MPESQLRPSVFNGRQSFGKVLELQKVFQKFRKNVGTGFRELKWPSRFSSFWGFKAFSDSPILGLVAPQVFDGFQRL